MRHRRRERRARPWRRHWRRGDRLDRRHHQRLYRVGLFRSEAHGAHRAQAQHSVRCALPIRARRRSGLRGARPRACHAHGARHLRRDPKQGRDRRQAAEAECALRLRSEARQELERSRPEGRRDQTPAQRAWRRAERHGIEAQGSAALMAPGHFRACRSRRGGGAARRRRSGSGDADAARGRRGAPGADRDAIADAARAPRARRARAGRGGDLVVHPA